MYCSMLIGINTNANTARCSHKDCFLLEGSLHLFTEECAVYHSNHDRSCVPGKRESAYHSAAGTQPTTCDIVGQYNSWNTACTCDMGRYNSWNTACTCDMGRYYSSPFDVACSMKTCSTALRCSPLLQQWWADICCFLTPWKGVWCGMMRAVWWSG